MKPPDTLTEAICEATRAMRQLKSINASRDREIAELCARVARLEGAREQTSAGTIPHVISRNAIRGRVRSRDSVEAEIATYRDAHAGAQTIIAELRGELEREREAKRQLSLAVEQLRERRPRLGVEIAEEALDVGESLADQRDRLRAQVAELEEENLQLCAEIDQLSGDRRKAAKRVTEQSIRIAELAEERDRARRCRERAWETVKSVRKWLGMPSGAGLAGEFSELRDAIGAQEGQRLADVASAVAQNYERLKAGAQRYLDARDQALRERDEAESRVAMLDAEIDSRREAVDEEIKAMSKVIASLTSERDEMLDELRAIAKVCEAEDVDEVKPGAFLAAARDRVGRLRGDSTLWLARATCWEETLRQVAEAVGDARLTGDALVEMVRAAAAAAREVA